MQGQDFRDEIDRLKFADEACAVDALLASAPLDLKLRKIAESQAVDLVVLARGLARRGGVMESFLKEYSP